MESAVIRKPWLAPSSSQARVEPWRGGDRARQVRLRTRAVTEVVAAAASSAPVDVSWEIIAGSLAGVTPFVVAGIEFSKRINVQKNCAVCKGSGLVRREKYFFRCPRCGGFLPWQSWKRFFTG